MSTQMDKLGYDNVFIGTVEGEPEETSCENVIKAVKDAGYKKVILRPLMVVAGDHANNDMAGDDDDSWKSQFTASGNFDSVDTQIAGLGEIEAVQKLYVEHTKKQLSHLEKFPGLLLPARHPRWRTALIPQSLILTVGCFMSTKQTMDVEPLP